MFGNSTTNSVQSNQSNLNRRIEVIQLRLEEQRQAQRQINRELTDNKENVPPGNLPLLSNVLSRTNREVSWLEARRGEAEESIANAQRQQRVTVPEPSRWNFVPSATPDTNNGTHWNNQNTGPSWNDPR